MSSCITFEIYIYYNFNFACSVSPRRHSARKNFGFKVKDPEYLHEKVKILEIYIM